MRAIVRFVQVRIMSETWRTGRAVSDIRVNPIPELHVNTNWAEPVSDSPIVNHFQRSFSVFSCVCLYCCLAAPVLRCHWLYILCNTNEEPSLTEAQDTGTVMNIYERTRICSFYMAYR